MNRVFISYSRKNEAFADRLARDLGDAGLDVWIDLRQIQVGEFWQQEIFRGLERSEFTVLCLSPASIASEWVQREIQTTRDAGKRIYPVMVQDCFKELQTHPTLSWLTDVQFIKFEGRYEQAFPELLAALPGGRALGTYDIYDPAKVVNPFKGLEAFQQRDAAYFFGREDLVQRAITRLRGTRFLAVVGASGSGKSSLVRAGIIPQIRNGALPESKTYPLVIFTPGAHPTEALAQRLQPLLAADDSALTLEHTTESLQQGQILLLVERVLTNLPAASRLVLVIDQFEEVFTRAGEKECTAFLQLLYAAAVDSDSRAILLITMRADFFGHLSRYPDLAALFEGNNLLIVTEMTSRNLVQAIEGPAKVVGLQYEAGLVDKILEDVKNQPAALPLLQYALQELFYKRDGANLTLVAYAEIGGVKQALARHAEGIFNAQDATLQDLMRRVLLRLVEVSETGEITRRRVSRSELRFRDVADADVDALLEILTAPEARLLVASRSVNTGGTEPVVLLEVSHEALIREWDRFKQWVLQDVEDLRYESELRKAAQDWQTSGRDTAYLLTGKRLSRAEVWLEDREVTLLQKELIEASLRSRQQEQELERNRMARELELQKATTRRARYGFFISALFLVVSLAGLLFLNSARLAVEDREALLAEQITITERNEAEARSLALAATANQVFGDSNGDLALTLALAANEGENARPEAERILADLAFSPGTRLRLATISTITALDFSLDGTRLAVGYENGQLQLLSTDVGEVVQTFSGHATAVTDIAISPDGTQILSASEDDTGNFILWDIASGQPARQWATYNDQKVNAVAFAGIEPTNVTNDVLQIATNFDNTVLVVGTNEGIVRRLSGSAVVWEANVFGDRRLPPRVTALAVSLDGTRILGGFSDGSIRLFDPETGDVITEFAPLDNALTGLAFIPATNYFVASGSDNVLRLWDVETGRQLQTFEVDSSITTLAMSPDGKTVATGVSNQTLRLWDILGGQEVLRSEEGFVSGVALSPDGKFAAVVGSSSEDEVGRRGVVTIRELATNTIFQTLTIPDDGSLFITVAFSADGRLLAAGTTNGSLALWDATTFTLLRVIPQAHTSILLSIAFSPDSSRVATGGRDARLVVWDTGTGEPVQTLIGHSDSVTSIVFSRDGQSLLSGSTDKALIFWDIQRGVPIRQFLGHLSAVRSVALNADATRALSGGADATVRVWDVSNGIEIQRFNGHDRAVNSVFFVGDSNNILTASTDGTVRVWDEERGIETRRFTITNSIGRTTGIKVGVLNTSFTQILVGLSDNTLRLLRILPEKEDLVSWTLSSRFIRALDCNEKILYGILEPVRQVFVPENTTASVFDSTNALVATLTANEAVQVLSDNTTGTVEICAANNVEGFVQVDELKVGR